jgi:hypothetical protein
MNNSQAYLLQSKVHEFLGLKTFYETFVHTPLKNINCCEWDTSDILSMGLMKCRFLNDHTCLQAAFRKFDGRYNDLICPYNLSLGHMLICFIPIVKPFLTHWCWLRVVPCNERGNRAHGGCDRSTGHGTWSHFWYIRRSVYTHSLICISFKTFEIDYLSLFLSFHTCEIKTILFWHHGYLFFNSRKIMKWKFVNHWNICICFFVPTHCYFEVESLSY